MKLAVVIPKYGLVGGAEGFAYEVTERLAAREGFEVHVFCNRHRPGRAPVTFHKIPILPFPRFMRQISFAYFADRLIRREGVDLIHSHDRLFRMDVLSMHGIPHDEWIRRVRQKRPSLFDRSVAWVERKGLTAQPPPMVLPVSELVKEELLKKFRIPPERMQVVHPGISEDRFDSLDRMRCRREIRARHGLLETDIIVLFVGMNFEVKRLGLVIQGLADLIQNEERASGLRLLVVGKGDHASYQAMARRLGVEKHIVFAGVSHEVEAYYMASDIFVMPSVFDTFGIVALEAMAGGLPVVISSKVGTKDLVKEGVQGFILGDDPEPRELAAKIALLLNPEQRAKMGEEARATALQHTWDRVADQMEEIFLHFFLS